MRPHPTAVWQSRHRVQRLALSQFWAAADWPKAPAQADDWQESDRLWRRSPGGLLLGPLTAEPAPAHSSRLVLATWPPVALWPPVACWQPDAFQKLHA